jgi:hypothetical protein
MPTLPARLQHEQYLRRTMREEAHCDLCRQTVILPKGIDRRAVLYLAESWSVAMLIQATRRLTVAVPVVTAAFNVMPLRTEPIISILGASSRAAGNDQRTSAATAACFPLRLVASATCA